VSTGRVYDLGYRGYAGALGGRGAAVRSIWVAALRRSIGLRRSWKQKVVPWLLLAVVSVPAVVQVGISYATRDSPRVDFELITYREYVGVSNALLVFVAVTAPELLCPDRRQRVLSLLFSRPITGGDYILAKAGAVATIVFTFGFLPQCVLFVGNMLVSDGALDYLTENAEVLWQVPLAVAALALFLAVVGTAVASLTTRRIVAAAVFLGLGFFGSSIAAALTVDGGSLAALVNVFALPLHVRDLIFLGHVGPDSKLTGVSGAGPAALAAYAVVVALASGVLYLRYRWVDR
jgi:ABC-2 type transport system permease protein